MRFPTISQSLQLALPVWLALAVLTTLPYVVAWVRTPPEAQFSGVLTAYDDTFTYLAWIEQAAQGRVLMCDLYTSEPQRCEFFLPLWMGLGFTARLTGLDVPVVFHAARLISALLMLMVAAWIAGLVFRSRTRIRWTLWLYAFGAGFGWLVYSLKSSGGMTGAGRLTGAVDLNLPEAIAFRSAFAQVHFTLGSALLFFAIGGFYVALLRRSRLLGAAAGLALSFLAVVYPYAVVVAGGLALAMFLTSPWLTGAKPGWLEQYLRCGAVAVLMFTASLPGIVYLLYLQQSNDLLREWLRITDTMSPSPIEYLLGFGILAIAAAFGLYVMSKGKRESWKLVLIWIAVQAAMLYSPTSFQRRLVEGLQLPLTVAASGALFWLTARLRMSRRPRAVALTVFIIVASVTNIGFLIGQAATPGVATSTDPRRYLREDVMEALRWFRSNSNEDDVVLCSYLSGSVLPAVSARRVYLGHYGLTVDGQTKGELVSRFFSGGMSAEEAGSFLRRQRIQYVLVGPFEQAGASGLAPPGPLSPVHRSGEVVIYAVDSDAN